MIAVKDTDLCKNVNSYMNKITQDEEAMIIVRENNQNIVMLSEESYNNLIENVYVMGNKSNYDWLMQSKAQLENGSIVTKQLIEVDADE